MYRFCKKSRICISQQTEEFVIPESGRDEAEVRKEIMMERRAEVKAKKKSARLFFSFVNDFCVFLFC